MALPLEAKEAQLRRHLAEDQTWTAFDDPEVVPRGWLFLPHPDGGIAAWRKPPRWALTQPPSDPIRLRVRGGAYKP